jgi:hypothetical protein
LQIIRLPTRLCGNAARPSGGPCLPLTEIPPGLIGHGSINTGGLALRYKIKIFAGVNS